MSEKFELELVRPTAQTLIEEFVPAIIGTLRTPNEEISIGINFFEEGQSFLRVAVKRAEEIFEKLSKETEIKVSVKE